MRLKLRSAGVAVAVAGLVVASTPDAVTAATSKTRAEGMTVIATGLDNPRGLAVTPEGVVLVAEAGRGGQGPCLVGGQDQVFCLGATGAITTVRGHQQKRVATGLPSLGTPTQSEVLGPHDIALTAAGPLVTIGLGTDPQRRAQLGTAGALVGQTVRLGPSGANSFADLAGWEAANNPDSDQPGTGPDSNPYGLVSYRDGAVATDAGGNTLLRLDRRGRISPLAVFPTTPTPSPFGGPDIPMQFVPTTVTTGPGGALYVGQLTGFPFPVGGAKVWRVTPGQAPTVYAEGFTNIADIAFDHKGRLLVLEITANGLLSGDPTGALIRVERDGSRTELARAGLVTPTGLAVARDGTIYISNKGTMVGQGEVLRLLVRQ
ncbi:ScyD/ScyE family protein [Micromonospora sp. CB01531]|uniref:ScyD/ScyE family protein n=1 Tax=Micromonospora sp. CB01531 TaxID=1718947 RepID=UPI0013015618|nr:ScyD/ScyE family protein [Micromonospora sp. CB01531]